MIVGRASLLSTLTRTVSPQSRLSILPRLPGFGARTMSATAPRPDPFRPAKRVAGQRQDVWYELQAQSTGYGFLRLIL